MQHRKSQIVPELWVAAQRRTCFLEVAERLQILLVFVESQAEVVENLCGALRVKRAEILVRRLLFVSIGFGCCLATTTSAALALALSKWLCEAFAHDLQLILFILAAGARGSRCRHIDRDVLGYFKELESL